MTELYLALRLILSLWIMPVILLSIGLMFGGACSMYVRQDADAQDFGAIAVLLILLLLSTIAQALIWR